MYHTISISHSSDVRKQQLPLRGTKTLLAVSTEKLKRTDAAYELGCALWRDVIPTILPTLLQLIGYVTHHFLTFTRANVIQAMHMPFTIPQTGAVFLKI